MRIGGAYSNDIAPSDCGHYPFCRRHLPALPSPRAQREPRPPRSAPLAPISTTLLFRSYCFQQPRFPWSTECASYTEKRRQFALSVESPDLLLEASGDLSRKCELRTGFLCPSFTNPTLPRRSALLKVC